MEIGSIRKMVQNVTRLVPNKGVALNIGEMSVLDPAYGVMYEQQIMSLDSTRPIVNEEGQTKQVPAGRSSWWTVDPLDGSRRFGLLGWLDCLGTMVGRVTDGQIDASYVSSFLGVGPGMIGFEPGCPLAHFDHEGNVRQLSRLANHGRLPLLVRAAPGNLTPLMRRLARMSDAQFVDGSIGLNMFPLWLGKACGMVLPLGHIERTPWDTTPIYGICQQLDIRAYVVTINGLEERPLKPLRATEPPRELLLAHASYASALQDLATSHTG